MHGYGNWIHPYTRWAYYCRAGLLCTYCQRVTVPQPAHVPRRGVVLLCDDATTLDHVVPPGGVVAPRRHTVVVACWRCNQLAGEPGIARRRNLYGPDVYRGRLIALTPMDRELGRYAYERHYGRPARGRIWLADSLLSRRRHLQHNYIDEYLADLDSRYRVRILGEHCSACLEPTCRAHFLCSGIPF